MSKTPNKLRAWKVGASNLILDTPYAKVRRDSCDLPNGVNISEYFYWEGGDFVEVFAMTSDGEVLLTRQYKHGVKEIVLELPAGVVDSDDESPLAAAKRELREETGYAGDDWSSLGSFNVSSAKATTQAFVFLARGVLPIFQQELDETEEIEIVTVTVNELLNLALTGKIRDSSSVATTFLALSKLGYDLAKSGASL